MKKTLAALAIAAISSLSTAQAAVVSFSDSKILTNTDWADTLTVNKFDSTLGTLTSIAFKLTGLVAGTGKAENLGGAAATTLKLASELTLTRPDTTTLVISNPVFSQLYNLGAFDGTIDFGGASGANTGLVTNTDNDTFISFSAADFSLFSAAGGGLINLGIKAIGNSAATGGGNVITQFATAAAGDVLVTYTYTPNTNLPEPATLALFAAGAGMIGVARRRKQNKA